MDCFYTVFLLSSLPKVKSILYWLYLGTFEITLFGLITQLSLGCFYFSLKQDWNQCLSFLACWYSLKRGQITFLPFWWLYHFTPKSYWVAWYFMTYFQMELSSIGLARLIPWSDCLCFSWVSVLEFFVLESNRETLMLFTVSLDFKRSKLRP